ncbi:MAG: aminotransferase class I/II-fold pyridoxal phosphate-dependent enzyme [Alphaproteobacteria bacterium]|nr:aminotransferase class I/II-fold pyridoxal phosphate-dependent enzyme [Alphaproteobacteria bacterium]
MDMKAKRAVILAAGAGRRLGAFTDAHPKPLLEIQGRSILENCLDQLAKNGIEQTVIIVGHMSEQIIARVGHRFAGMTIAYVTSDKYQTTNNIYSLWCARAFLDQAILLLEADIFFDGRLIAAIQDCGAENVVAVARHKPGMDGTVIRMDESYQLTELIEGARQPPDFDYSDAYKTVNIYRFSARFLAREFVPDLERTVTAGQTGGYYELLLKDVLARDETALVAVDCSAIRWFEIDDDNDRRLAEYLFSPPEKKLSFLSSQYGSYWRYEVVDHSYLYNMYFPPPDMWKRLANDMQIIAKQYPVGQAALADLLSDGVDERTERLVVANGASELIRVLCGVMNRRVIVPVPSFNEYENATPPERLSRFPLSAPNFFLDVDAYAEASRVFGADMAVVVSPNNPTSALVPHDDLIRLCEKLRTYGIFLLLDESFVDFCASPQEQTLQHQLDTHDNLVILKSMSKVYGIGGIRLGYLASANIPFLEEVRKHLPIWNINGFAEGFLRLLPRYRGEFRKSREAVYRDSAEFHQMLTAIPGVSAPIPQANFIFLRLKDGQYSGDIARRFFVEHNIIVKHCAQKSMPDGERYLRVSTRTPDENRRFASLLAEMMH